VRGAPDQRDTVPRPRKHGAKEAAYGSGTNDGDGAKTICHDRPRLEIWRDRIVMRSLPASPATHDLS
jgi:hypothetical protein